jgi:tetratricopeptide (TPR) repeat protein
MLFPKVRLRFWRQATLWWRSRNFLIFLLGSPALLGGGAAAVLTVLCLSQPEQEIEARYLDQAKKALKSKDYSTALTCYERLAHHGGERPEVLYGLALAAESLGQAERAAAIMHDLAPTAGGGYGPAHLWCAAEILRAGAPPPRARQEAEAHLLRALDGELDDREAAHAMLGELYLASGKLDQAEPHLTHAVKAKPHLRLRLATLYVLKGNKDRARGEALLAVNFYRARSQTDPQNHQARLHWADAVTFLEDYPTAVSILEEGLAASHEAAYGKALAAVYLLWSDALGRDGKGDAGQRLALIEKGIRWGPSNAGLLDRLSSATRTDGPEADKAREVLHRLLSEGKAAATAHFALGLDAWEHDRHDEARVHWERAHELAPQAGVIANNLALALTEGSAPELPRALSLVNLALDHSPGDVNFRDTRGRILARMGKWKEALPDLEAALTQRANQPELHRTLAETYDHLGVPAMAAEHKRLAEATASRASAVPGKVH